VLVDYFREQYGELACIDVQYYPEGVNYLLDRQLLFTWNDKALHDVAKRVEQKLSQIQMKKLEQFIRGKPMAVVVDAAAMQIGAPLSAILEAIMFAVMRKQYTEEQHLERRTKLQGDLETARRLGLNLDEQDIVISDDETILKRGEFVAAYRKFLADHCADALKTTKQTSWLRAYQLFGLPEHRIPLYESVNAYRRGHLLAADLPDFSLEELKDLALADLAQLYPAGGFEEEKEQEQEEEPSRVKDIEDYLRRHLEVWDSANQPVLTALRFGDNLREYANLQRLNGQCCHCGTSLPARAWMARQVPPRMSVQQFSNRLEGGSAKDPKRNVCEVCRMQFILEKLAWRGHGDKQEAKQTTFYLHLFPFAFFTRPLLRAWWLSVEKLKDADHSAFFLETKEYFRLMQPFQTELRIQGFRTTTNGLNLPTFSDAISTTPILPIVAPGENYGLQFLLALEKAVVLTGWFECRALLSRSPLPTLNLAREKRENQPVVLLVEGAPRNMQWLVPQTSLTRETFEVLRQKLSLLHQLEEKLFYPDPQRKKEKDLSRIITHDFAAAAADDPLALYFQADRAIEAKIAAETGKIAGNPEFRALVLSRTITPILNTLLELS
ncbi:MAG TPA: hypothetical protein VFV38_10005, partial [Ktedonobacteraceae bacterium]|nr:hypothetical protein [Ktedonobacteraceae bacterium]